MKNWHFRLLILCGFLITSTSGFADTPAFVSSVHMPAPMTGGSRAALDGRRFVAQLQAGDNRPAGIQIIDTSDIEHPRTAGFLPMPNGTLALSDDGTQALLLVASEKESYNQATAREVIAIDLSDADHPREAWRKTISARTAALAGDASAYAYSALSDPAQGKWKTTVAFVREGQPQLELEEEQYSSGAMKFSPHAKFLAYTMVNEELYAWDLKSSQPKLYKQEYSSYQRYNCIPLVFDNGYVVAKDTRQPRLGIYMPAADMPRVSTLALDSSANADWEYCDPLNPGAADARLVFSDGRGRLLQMDLHNPAAPLMGKTWLTQETLYPVAVAQDILFADSGNTKDPELKLYRLGGGQPAATDWQALAVKYKAIMETYGADLKANKPLPYFDAVRRFEEAGILAALDAPVEKISNQEAAAILNDYGFLANKKKDPASLVERALRRAIALDPRRKVAYLNLADFLRERASETGANGGDANQRAEEIKKNYRAYRKLGGKPSPLITAYLKGTPALQTGDACTAIAAYANNGRLNELVSESGANVPMKGKKVDLIFTTEGTAHVPAFYAFDSATDFPLKEDAGPALPPGAEELWGGDELGLLTYRGEPYILYYRDLGHPVSARSLKTDATCEFTVATEEKLDPKAAEPELCAKLHAGSGPQPFAFEGTSPMSHDDIAQQWGESQMTGTRLLDFANDGKPSTVAELEMTSGAGAGCDEFFYETVTTDATQFAPGAKRDLLMQLQGADPANRYPILPCGNQPAFFSYKGRVFFETKSKAWPPVDNWSQYHRVTTVRNGEVREVCNFTFESRVSVKK